MDNKNINDCFISRDKTMLQLDRVCALLKQTYWASKRDVAAIKKSIENSVCYGVYSNGIQIGFARVITDLATTYYLCDVIVDEACRGKGIGKKLIGHIINDAELSDLSGMLITKDAHLLYEKYGFISECEKFMIKKKS